MGMIGLNHAHYYHPAQTANQSGHIQVTKSAKSLVMKPQYRMKVVQDKTKYNRKKRDKCNEI